MEPRDSSEDNYFRRLFSEWSETLEDGLHLRGHPLKEGYSKDGVLDHFRGYLVKEQNRALAVGSGVRAVRMPPAYAPCVTPFSELEKLMISDLKLETHHRGAFLVLRALSPPEKRGAMIMALAEDENKDLIALEMYFQMLASLPKEATLIIKEPYLKMMAHGHYVIRVDHLSDVFWNSDKLTPNDWLQEAGATSLSAGQLILKGIDSMKRAQYFEAIQQ